MMKRALVAWFVWLLALCGAFACSQADRTGEVLYTFLDQQPKVAMVGAFDGGIERAWCVVGQVTANAQDVGAPQDSATMVTQVVPGVTHGASRFEIEEIDCPLFRTTAVIHTHPFHICSPSRADWQTLHDTHQRYAGILCGEGPTIAWYYERDNPLR